MRITPVGNVGIGDFSANGFGLNEQPSHRLDVIGNARFRQLSNNTPDVLFTGVQESSVGDYELNYLSFNGSNDQFLAGDGTWQTVNAAANDCDWQISGNNLITGLNGSTCPVPGTVSIGTTSSIGKFNTYVDPVVMGQNTNFEQKLGGTGDASSVVTGTYTEITGHWHHALGHNIRIFGLDNSESVGYTASVIAEDRSFGGSFHTYTADIQYAVSGTVRPACSDEVYAVYGRVAPTEYCPPTIAVDHWAGYFEGDVFTSGNTVGFSDETLKSEISDVNEALEIVQALTPSTYEYNQEQNPSIKLASGTQTGFIAQNVREVLPHAVKEVKLPELRDEDGTITREQQSFLGVVYDQIIPVNTAAIQEQQEMIETLRAQNVELQRSLEELTALVNECCSRFEMRSENMEVQPTDMQILIEKTTLDQNIPNPFEIYTTINFHLAFEGEVVLKVLNQQGQTVEILDEGLRAEGDYSIKWDSTNTSSGIYFYSLTVDGVEMVRRAVKI